MGCVCLGLIGWCGLDSLQLVVGFLLCLVDGLRFGLFSLLVFAFG